MRQKLNIMPRIALYGCRSSITLRGRRLSLGENDFILRKRYCIEFEQEVIRATQVDLGMGWIYT